MTSNSDEDNLSGHLIICGLGHVGYRCLCLANQLGQKSVVISLENNQRWRLPASANFRILVGDARDEKLLREAGVERARAIIVVTDDDLTNVSIALDARRLNPRLSIVARVFDQAIAGHLEKSIDIDRVLSASALATPAFVAAALHNANQGAFEADGMVWIVEQHAATQWASATPAAGQPALDRCRAVIAVQQADGAVVRPTSATNVASGERVTLLRCAKNDRRFHAAAQRDKTKKRRITTFRGLAVGARQWWREMPRPLRTASISLLLIVASSVVVFRLAIGLSLVDALYFTVTTVTTVGYGDYNLMNSPPWLKLYGSLVMLCGAAIVAMLFSMVTDLMLRARLRDVFSRGKAHLRGHVIVAGLGSIGFRLVRDLVHFGETVVAIECRENAEYLQSTRELASVILGNAKTEETLRRAGVAGAKTVIAATDDDLTNLSIALTAKRVNAACRVVLRIFDPALAEKMQHCMTIDSVLSVSVAAASAFVGAAICSDLLHGMVLDDQLLLFFHRAIPESSPHIGRPALAMDEHESAVFVKRTGAPSYAVASADDILREGDVIIGVRWLPLVNPQCER